MNDLISISKAYDYVRNQSKFGIDVTNAILNASYGCHLPTSQIVQNFSDSKDVFNINKMPRNYIVQQIIEAAKNNKLLIYGSYDIKNPQLSEVVPNSCWDKFTITTDRDIAIPIFGKETKGEKYYFNLKVSKKRVQKLWKAPSKLSIIFHNFEYKLKKTVQLWLTKS